MKGKKEVLTEATTQKTKRARRPVDEKKALINRLKRIEGQVRGIQSMIEKDADPADMLIQTSAVNAAINAFNRELLSAHIRGKVAEELKKDNYEAATELATLVQKLMK